MFETFKYLCLNCITRPSHLKKYKTIHIYHKRNPDLYLIIKYEIHLIIFTLKSNIGTLNRQFLRFNNFYNNKKR